MTILDWLALTVFFVLMCGVSGIGVGFTEWLYARRFMRTCQVPFAQCSECYYHTFCPRRNQLSLKGSR